jgi:putative SOS response-associated peptidase YedK
MCNLYSITTNQAAIINLFRVINRYVGNLAPMPGVFPDFPAPVIRNTESGTELVMMRWGMPPPPRTGGPPVTNIRNTNSPHWRACGSSQPTSRRSKNVASPDKGFASRRSADFIDHCGRSIPYGS